MTESFNSSSQTPIRPLDGVTVLAFEHAVAAPVCTRHLADQGARVIKIERPGVGDFARNYDQRVLGQSSYFVWANRSKESLTLNVKHVAAADIIERLLAKADVVIQNLAPGASARLGLDFASLQARYPRLIVCDISGYGSNGPYRDKKAYDLMVQAEAGLLAATGQADGMARAGFSVADVSAGMYAYTAILNALLLRARTGVGAQIDVAMLETLTEWMGNPMYYSFDEQPPAPRTGGAHPSIAPYGPVRVGDGQTLMMGVQNEREWQSFCSVVLEQPDLASDARFASNTLRSQNRQALAQIVNTVFATLSTEAAEQRLETAQIALSRVNTAADLWQHPQLQARRRWVQVETPNGPIPALLPPGSSTAYTARMDAVPSVGQHTDSVLAELGFDDAAIAQLHAGGAV